MRMAGIDRNRATPNQVLSPIRIVAIPINQMAQMGAVLIEDRNNRDEIDIVMGNAAKRENQMTASSLFVFSYFSPPAIRARSMVSMFIFVCPTSQISHVRRAWVPPLLKYRAMLSGDITDDSGEIKGVAAVAAGSALSSTSALVGRCLGNLNVPRHPSATDTASPFEDYITADFLADIVNNRDALLAMAAPNLSEDRLPSLRRHGLPQQLHLKAENFGAHRCNTSADRFRSDTTGRSPGVVCSLWLASS